MDDQETRIERYRSINNNCRSR